MAWPSSHTYLVRRSLEQVPRGCEEVKAATAARGRGTCYCMMGSRSLGGAQPECDRMDSRPFWKGKIRRAGESL